jgi:histidinol-phosphate aminotransferase
VENDPSRFIRPDFAGFEPYTPVQPLDVLAREIGLPIEQLAKLDANENLYGPASEVRAAIDSADLHIYPDPGQYLLREAIATYTGVKPEQVVAGAGADDLIDILLRLVEPESVVVAPPSFGMYSFLAQLCGSRTVEISRGEGFALDLPAIAAAVKQGARMIFVASPNNPTGNRVSDTEVEALCANDALVVVDEAYIEFAGGSCVPLLSRWPNLVVLRTFSKWAALAGLRVGYALCHPSLAGPMMAIKQPYNVNVAADVAARAAIEHRGTIMATVRCLVTERDRMVEQLRQFDWLTPHPSEANFVLFAVHGRPAGDVARALRQRGVLVRYYDRPELSGYIRISAGRPEDTERLVKALREVGAA